MLQALKTLFATSFVALANAHGYIGERSDSLSSGTYVVGSISVPGFTIGEVVPGPFVGVANTTTITPDTITFDITQSSDGYVISLDGLYAAPVDDRVGLIPDYPGEFWNIVPTEGLYAIETADGQSLWILPHDAPEGTPVALTSVGGEILPSSLFFFSPE